MKQNELCHYQEFYLSLADEYNQFFCPIFSIIT